MRKLFYLLTSNFYLLFGCQRWLVRTALAALLLVAGDARTAVELEPIASGLNAPLFVASAQDGSGRLFIGDQNGRIRILLNGELLFPFFLDIEDHVRIGPESGLLGFAFHPNYRNNGRFFVYYTRDGPSGLESALSEFVVSADPNFAVKESERTILTIPQPTLGHEGGMLAFGPDGFLYIASGDGGLQTDPLRNGQNRETLLGKILRIDVDSTRPYAIPPDNPFVGRPGRDEIWAYGLRNPYRFSFDRATGRLFAGDVGQDRREELDLIVRGGNYGWNVMEGTLCHSPPSGCSTPGLIAPIHEYGREVGGSVIGGYVYRGTAIPSLVGKYVFGDFLSGQIWTLTQDSSGRWQREELLNAGFPISSLGEGEAGELYLVNYRGSVYRMIDPSQPRVASQNAAVNAASLFPGPVAPGEIVRIFGSNLGPAEGSFSRLDASGRVDTFVADTQVLFDGVPAPLFYLRTDQIHAQVPYEVAGKSRIALRVQYRGVLSDPATLSVANAAPGIFALAGGTGTGVILNQDSSLNSSVHPAPRGSVVVFYATGEGQTELAGISGQPARAPLPKPLLPVSLRIGDIPAEVLSADSAPGFAGVLQVSARVPLGVTPGNAVPVTLTIGSATSQPGITLAVE